MITVALLRRPYTQSMVSADTQEQTANKLGLGVKIFLKCFLATQIFPSD